MMFFIESVKYPPCTAGLEAFSYDTLKPISLRVRSTGYTLNRGIVLVSILLLHALKRRIVHCLVQMLGQVGTFSMVREKNDAVLS